MNNNEATGQKHIIDLAGDPMPQKWLQNGYRIEIKKHAGEGLLELEPTRLQLYLSSNQQGMVSQPKRFPSLSEGYAATRELVGKKMTGRDLLKELEENKIPVMNTCVLDYLLAHPELIPENWKKDEKGDARNIFFWGTIYHTPKEFWYPHGKSYVRGLIYRHNSFSPDLCRWHWLERNINSEFGTESPAAILANTL